MHHSHTSSKSYPFIKLHVSTVQSSTPGLTTTLASSIMKVLENDDDGKLHEFDQLRYLLKDAKMNKTKIMNKNEKIAEYKSLAASLSRF